MSKKVKVAEKLAETLEEYASDVEEGIGEVEGHYGSLYIVDGLCDMNEIMFNDEVREGRFYESFMLFTDKPIKLFDVVEVDHSLSGKSSKLKVMSIVNVKPSTDGKMMVEFLAKKIRED